MFKDVIVWSLGFILTTVYISYQEKTVGLGSDLKIIVVVKYVVGGRLVVYRLVEVAWSNAGYESVRRKYATIVMLEIKI